MEKLLATGKVRAIGVSNFNIRRLEELLGQVSVVPAANQIEAHPYLQQPELLKFCQSKGIVIEAYSPLGNNQTGEPRTVDDPVVAQVAQQVGMDPGPLWPAGVCSAALSFYPRASPLLALQPISRSNLCLMMHTPS